MNTKKVTATLFLAVFLLCMTGQASAQQQQTIALGPGSSHPGTTGEVTLALEDIFLDGAPHAYGFIWDIAIDDKKGEVYVLCEPRRVRGVGEVRVFDRPGARPGELRVVLGDGARGGDVGQAVHPDGRRRRRGRPTGAS